MDQAKPPAPIKLRLYLDETRLYDLKKAVLEFMEAGYQIRAEWVSEYNEIVARLAAASGKRY